MCHLRGMRGSRSLNNALQLFSEQAGKQKTPFQSLSSGEGLKPGEGRSTVSEAVWPQAWVGVA